MYHYARIIFGNIAFLTLLSLNILAQETGGYQTSFATEAERIKLRNELISDTIEGNLSLPLAQTNEIKWVTAFWAMELLGHRPAIGRQALFQVFRTFQDRFISLQRAALEASYALFQDDFTTEIKIIADSTASSKLFAMAALQLLRQDGSRKNRDALFTLMQKRFPQWQDDPILWSLSLDFRQPNHERLRLRPPMLDLFRHGGERGKTNLFCIQRINRDYPGLTIVKKPDNTFLRNPDGSLFAIPHFTRSLSAQPGYLTNGNTPQGVLSVQSIEGAGSLFIGPTPVLNLVLPFEASVAEYFHNPTIQDTAWTIEHYKKLLPYSWRNYEPMREAFYAGKAGRTEIIAHGTTIDPEYYRDKSYYPYTPSLGCLTTLELWSGKDGRQIVSDQCALIHAFRAAGADAGYVIIVEKDDKKAPVTLQEIIMDVLRAESSL
ncbi:hypothetical protein JXO59_10180 [candidate division KSB1 bacterium]|nr:hypothetical protein [candidate division KSB1 bacterium]